MRLWGLLLISILLFSFSSDRFDYPQDDFVWPVKHAIKVSGTFGELRPNHFHAGVDLKSNRGGTGDPLRAAAGGHVSRIKVQAAGYGNALYIDHPNGYTTVYAHMQQFSEEIAEYVKQQQYERESFEVDLYPTKDLFPLEQGDYIGNMGSTGSSQGPHLHFEIRDTESEMPVNPLLFGLEIPDRRPPRLHKVKLYGFDALGREMEDNDFSLRARSGEYRVSGDTLTTAWPNFGVAVKAFDHHDNVSNWNGIFGLKMLVDDSLVYQYDMERFSFDETRYINALLDYPERIKNRSYYYRCFSLPGNDLSMLAANENNGLLTFTDSRKHKIEIQTYDVDGNEAKVVFWVRASAEYAQPKEMTYHYVLPHGESNLIQEEDFAIYFPESSLYEDLYLKLYFSDDRSYGHYSQVLHIQDKLTPVHRFYDVALRPNKEMTPEEKDRAFIAWCGTHGEVLNLGGEWQSNGMLRAKSRLFGNFAILTDDVAPDVDNISLRSDMRGRNSFSLRISDNIPTGRGVEGIQYRATIDGEWILMTHDAKSRRITHRFDRNWERGEHELKLVVTDAVGNETVYERRFVR
ncbi:MAG: M23 family metallopeptidase [Bacteroidetes bacterium]|nr:M23 family metallopeptidase [Bacteroidota bacterium]